MNKILFHDTETTGLPDWKTPSGGKNQPHIVQLAAILADAESRKVIKKMDVIIKPEGWIIPDETIELHGITNEHAHDVGIPEKEALSQFMEMWDGGMRVAHNRTFDQRIIRIAHKRYSSQNHIDAWASKEDFDCTMLMSTPILKLSQQNKRGSKWPKLEEAYKHLTGKKLEGGHSAMADTEACMEIYWIMRDRQRNLNE